MSDNNNDSKPTYAQVAASPAMQDDDENEPRNAADENGRGEQQEKLVTVVGGAHFSRPKPKEVVAQDDGKPNTKGPKGSVSSGSGSSEPEIINAEPQPTPPLPSNNSSGKQPKPAKEGEPPILDNVIEEFVPVKHTTMLTTKGKGDQKKTTVQLDTTDNELEVVCDETEKRKRFWSRVAIAGGGVLLIAVVGVVVWKYTRKPRPLF